MSNRLALIVDDSRSARHILSRMLESFGLEVASVESAELALTYLQGARPDVIFMDHLMPGMDGFAAVRVLKSNPDTVTIPVLMYTSQEGEMYLSQARALGAMGVLPKTLKHADVAEALQHLNLLPPEKAGATTTATAAPVHQHTKNAPARLDRIWPFRSWRIVSRRKCAMTCSRSRHG
jgi:CheY-like chemotaxis protein